MKSLAADPAAQERLGFSQMARGWEIGTAGWRRALAEAYAQRPLNPALPADELAAFRHRTWEQALDRTLRQLRRTAADVQQQPGRTDWKLEVALQLRREAGVPYPWIARKLNFGTAGSLRVAIHRCNAVTA